jgi:hypothetical protein
MSQLDQASLPAVSMAGELLIRAAAALGTLDPSALEALRGNAESNIVGGIALALNAAANLSPSVKQSLDRYPPAGFPLDVSPADILDEAIRAVCDTSFECGEHDSSLDDEPYEAVSRRSDAAIKQLKTLFVPGRPA